MHMDSYYKLSDIVALQCLIEHAQPIMKIGSGDDRTIHAYVW